MSDFLEKTDFITIINTAALDIQTGGDDSIITEMALEAIAEMKAFLATRYDVAVVFGTAGTERHKTVLMYAKDIALYHIFSRRHTNAMPEIRFKRYENALKWLKDVQAQIINPTDLPVTVDPAKALIKTGGNPKRENHQE